MTDDIPDAAELTLRTERLVLRPIERITNVARSINATDLNRRINLSGPDDELGQLADTFDDMLDRLSNAFDAQTRFIHEASHELRNPLAVIRTNLDVALADPDASADDARAAELPVPGLQELHERLERLAVEAASALEVLARGLPARPLQQHLGQQHAGREAVPVGLDQLL